jgi:uncharacterized protein
VIDVEKVVAIDVHTHVEVSADGHDPMPPVLREASAKYFRGGGGTPTVADVAEHFRERDIAAVVFTVDYESQSGIPPVSNDEVIAGAAEHDDVLIPFASVDPHRGDAVERARSAIEAGARGFKFHPNLQAFFPNEREFYPLYEVIEAAGLPALFHTGHSGIGSGVPGGGGIRLKYSNPIHVDDVAADFPAMPIVLAHPSFPWQDEAISMAMHKPQVHIDLSGWSPKYFPPQLVRYANTLLRHQVLFGSDFPMIPPDKWLRDFEKVEIDDDVRPLVLKDNAVRLLGLG